jgi:hypothetical protein
LIATLQMMFSSAVAVDALNEFGKLNDIAADMLTLYVSSLKSEVSSLDQMIRCLVLRESYLRYRNELQDIFTYGLQ